MDYTTPVTAAFELQRQTIKNSQQAVQQSVEFQQRVNRAVVDSFASQQSAQRRAAELSQTAIHSYLDAVEATVPGTAGTLDEMRASVDEQFEYLLENHAETFETVATEYEAGVDAYDEMAGDLVDAVEEQVGLLVEAHEELESQSADVAEQWTEQLDTLKQQVEDVQQQVEDVQRQAAEAVEA